MSYNRLIKLNYLNKRSWLTPTTVLMILVTVSAIVSSEFEIVAILAAVYLGLDWTAVTLRFYNIKDNEFSVNIFPDGRVVLLSAGSVKEEGVLDQQQWCTHHAAVLRVLIRDEIRMLVVLPKLQKETDDFRRLNMWLRQEFATAQA